MTLQSIREQVLKEIEAQKIEPKARWRFVVSSYGVWIAIVLLVVLGGLGIGQLIYIAAMSDVPYLLYVGLSKAVLLTISLWLFAISGLLFLAYYQLEQSKRGYRYSLPALAGSLFVMVAIIGGVVHALGVSQAFDRTMSERVPFYRGVERVALEHWMHPKEGRMVAYVTQHVAQDTLAVKTADGAEWLVVLPSYELSGEDWLRFAEEPLLILGVPRATSTFEACALRPLRPLRHLDPAVNERMPRFARIKECKKLFQDLEH